MNESDKLFSINHETCKNISIYHLKGTLSQQTVNEFTNYLSNYTTKPNIALDFKDLTFIDSMGIGTIINVLTSLKKNNGQLICYNLNDEVFSIFEVAKLTTFLNILTEKDFKRKYPKIEAIEDIFKNKDSS